MTPICRKNRLAFWRQIRGVSQEELAQRLGVSRGLISHWELDKAVPDPRYIGRISQYLRVPVPKLWPREPYI